MPKKIVVVVIEDVDFLEKSLSKFQESLKKDCISALIYVKQINIFFKVTLQKKFDQTEKKILNWLNNY